jgi:hypothetical protein
VDMHVVVWVPCVCGCATTHTAQQQQQQQQRLTQARTSSSRIFCTMNVATVLDSSLPISMVRRHSGMISVESRKLITSVSSTCHRPRHHDARSLRRLCTAAIPVQGGGEVELVPLAVVTLTSSTLYTTGFGFPTDYLLPSPQSWAGCVPTRRGLSRPAIGHISAAATPLVLCVALQRSMLALWR